MIGTPALYSRLLFVFVLVCAAVMSFVMCSDAARAVTTQVDNSVRHNVLRRLYTPHSQHHPLFAGLPPTETGLQTGTNSETETSGNHRGASSIIDHRSNPVWFTEGSLGYKQHSPDNRQSQAGVRPLSSYHPLSYNSVIIRKPSHKEAVSPFQQVWDPKNAQKSYMNEEVPSLFPAQTDRYRSTSLPTSGGLFSSYKDTNELAAAGAWSSSTGIKSSKFLGFVSQTAPHAPPVGNGLDTPVIKGTVSSEKLSQGLHSLSSSETPRLKKVQSYLFKDPQTAFDGHETVHGNGLITPHKQSASDVQVYSRFSSNVNQLQRKHPVRAVQNLSVNANPPYHNANAQTGFTKHTTQISVSPAPGKDPTMGGFVPTPHADFQGNFPTSSGKSVVSSSINATTRGSMLAHTPGRAVKNIYGFRGFENPTRTPIRSNERTNTRRYSFNKGNGNKITNMYPSLSSKYSFGQREASTTPARLQRTDYPPPSPPGTHQSLTSGFKEARPLLPGRDASVDRNPDRRIHRRIYGLKGFRTRPLGGAKTLASEPDKSARVQQSFEGFKVRSSQNWQPKSSQNELSSEDLNPVLQNESVTSFTPDKYKNRRKIYTFPEILPIKNQTVNANNSKAHEQNSTSHIIPSAYLKSAGKLTLESRPTPEPRTPEEIKPVARRASLFSRSTSSTVRGKRVRGNSKKLNASTPTSDLVNSPIVRLPKRPAKVITVTYADILGSASFSGVTATTPITLTDNMTATTEPQEEAGSWTVKDEVLSRDNTSRGPDAEDVEGDNFSSGSDMNNLDLFLDNEGSGSGDFSMSDVLSTDTTKSEDSEDLSELEYLRISTGNVSFKSMKLSHTETREKVV